MFEKTVDPQIVEKVAEALKSRGMSPVIVASAAEAKEKVLELIPEGSEVMTMTSITLEQTGISEAINSSGKYKAAREVLWSKDSSLDEKKRAGNLADWTLGSVHAITEDGQVVVASGTGSQLPAYVYASDHVVWVVGTQKIVKNLDEAMQRINEYIVPLESVRARKAYGLPETWNTSPNKVVIFNKEAREGRITVVLVQEALGF